VPVGSRVAHAEVLGKGPEREGREPVASEEGEAAIQELAPQVLAVIGLPLGPLLSHSNSITEYVDDANIPRYISGIDVGTVYMEVLMKVLYVFDEDGPDRREAGSALAAWAQEGGHDMAAMIAPALKPCLGCFGCWTKTPGHCAVKGDEEASFIEAMYRADLVLLGGATPYGCFALPIKAALDRAIPLLLPYFRKYRGEMHHVPRYSHLPRILSPAFGDASEAEDAPYLELVRSFCDNIYSPRQKSFFRYGGDPTALLGWLGKELAS